MDADCPQRCSPVQNIVCLIFDQPNERLTEPQLAESVGYSTVHTRRMFYETMGETLGSYLHRVRLEYAAGLLSMGDMPIKEVAVEVGYSSGGAFARAFHAEFEILPAKFRALNRGEDHLLPVYIYQTDPVKAGETTEVGHYISTSEIFTRSYDGPSYIGSIRPDSPNAKPELSLAEGSRGQIRDLQPSVGGY